MSTTPQAVRDQIAALAAPLHEQLKQVDEAYESKRTEMVELRELRNELRSALKTLDPAFAARLSNKPGPKPKRSGGSTGFQPDSPRLHEIADWLRANAEEFNGNGGFYATEIAKREDAPVTQSRMNKALKVLHEQGVVRLDRKEGLTKMYKVVG